jgi:hypothetical protein
MRCHEHRDWLLAKVKSETISDLTDAYSLMAGSKKRLKPEADKSSFDTKMEKQLDKFREKEAAGLKLTDTIKTLGKACDREGGKIYALVGTLQIRAWRLTKRQLLDEIG